MRVECDGTQIEDEGCGDAIGERIKYWRASMQFNFLFKQTMQKILCTAK